MRVEVFGRARSLLAGFLLLLLAAQPARNASTVAFAVDEPTGEIIAFWRQLREWRPESGLAADVSGSVLVRDALELRLDEGTLTLLDLGDRTVGAVFEGSARVRITAPTRVERRQLARFFGAEVPEIVAERLFLLFADSTVVELRSIADFRPAQLSRSARGTLRDATDVLVGKDEGAVSSSLVRPFLNREPSEYFRAHVFLRNGDDLSFVFDDSLEEEVSVGREASGDRFETLSSFHRRAAYGPAGVLTAPSWVSRPVDALHYVAQLDLDGLDEVVASSEVLLVPNVPGGNWVAATLFHELEVDSLRWADGTDVVYDRSDDELSALWIRLPGEAREGVPLTLRAWYRGDIVDRTQEGFYYVRTTSNWLPRFGSSAATYDLSFASREDWPVMSVGRRVSRAVDLARKRVVTRWVTEKPSSQVTFSVGDFEEYEFPDGVTAPIRVHMAETFHARFADMASRAAAATGGAVNIITQVNPEEQVHRDIQNGLRFFTERFGALDFEEYNVAEIPGSHGQAFPGMINLSWLTFGWTREQGFDEIFRAHEVAHQWWGIGAEPQTYHDVWLSEGLSEFSALWYMHRVRANPQRYLDRLADLRESILERRGESGPVWLGPRLAVGRDGGEDYRVTVYSKGAWVMHMLRNLLLDHDTGSEEVFEQLMREVFARFRDSTISTEGFRSLLETYLGADMGWFFDQWVYGTDIPRYRFAYTTAALPDGRVRMTVRVRQEDVPEGFRMPVPILLDFGDEGSAVVTVMVTGAEVVTELPVLPRVPDDVTFNVLESVLAEVDTERW